MGRAINRVGNNAVLFLNKEAWPDKIGMIGCVRQMEVFKILFL